jgi:maltose O-acetyltransferase
VSPGPEPSRPRRHRPRRSSEPSAFPTLLPADFPSPATPPSPITGVRTRWEAPPAVEDLATGPLPVEDIPVRHPPAYPAAPPPAAWYQSPPAPAARAHDPLTDPLADPLRTGEGRHLPVAPVWTSPLLAPVTPAGGRPSRVLHEPPPTQETSLRQPRSRRDSRAGAAARPGEPVTWGPEPLSRSQVRARERADSVPDDASGVRTGLRAAVVNSVAGARGTPHALRLAIYRRFGIDVDSAKMLPGTQFRGRAGIRVGAGSLIGRGCLIEAEAEVVIGAGTRLGPGVTVVTADGGPPAPVRVGDRCRIGTRSVLLPGVTVGDDVVVLAGSVVIGDCRSGGTYAGAPAVRIA